MLRTICVLLLLSPATAIAQTAIEAGAFLETGVPAAARAGFGGEVTYDRHLIQLRLSGRTGALELEGKPRFWGADVDVKLAPLTVHPVLGASSPFGAEPYLFVGAGARAQEAGAGAGTRWATSLSWGAGVRLPVLGQVLALYGEGRNRSGDWEARGGVALRLTRGARRAPTGPAHARGGHRPPAVPEHPTDVLGEQPSPAPAERSAVASLEGDLPPTLEEQPASRHEPAAIVAIILAEAERHLGVRYVWGGSDPETGFDCSGFVQYVYGKVGIALPRVTRDQAKVGSDVPLDRDSFQPGDLLFFASNGRRIDHVAIYAGDGRIIHAPARSSHVRYDSLWTPEGRWFRERLVKARRVF